MDKNTTTGLLLILVIFFGFTWYNSKQAAEYQREKAIWDSIALAQERIADVPGLTQESFEDGIIEAGTDGESADSLRMKFLGEGLYNAQHGRETEYTLENDLVRITLSNKGAMVTGVTLKEYDRYDGDPVSLIAPGTAGFDLSFYILRGFNNFQVNTADYYFTEASEGTVPGSNSISFRLPVEDGMCVEYIYTLRDGEYMVDFNVRFLNMRDILAEQYDVLVNWHSVAPQNEKGFDNENMYSYIAYRYPGDKSVEDLGQSKSTKEKNLNSRLQWIAFKQQFFSSIFIADTHFENAAVRYETFVPGSGNLKKYTASIAVPFNKLESDYAFRFYYGPNKYTILKQYDNQMERLVPLGPKWVRWVNRWIVIPVFNFFGSYIGSYGLIILLLTLFIKVLLLPFTYKSYLSQAKMRLLKPEMEEINARYPKQEDAMKKQQAVMEMYKKAGVSPMGGCLPMLLQLPILFALFRFFPSSIELRGEPFLWATDLSSYDSILNLPFNIPFYGDHVSLFTLLMAFMMYLTSRINLSQQATATPQMGGMKFMMLYMMPVMMMFWFNNYASGLSYYYTLSTLITLAQTYGFRYIVNDDKLHARMKENAKKAPKKKSKWQARYEEMLKAQQQQAQAQQQPKNKKKR
ncbi:MAG: membrane protein insertase YidC [Rikenellaceae bacterium]|nr:membrane protein insertase YidC [Rikenellaceae bacterium]